MLAFWILFLVLAFLGVLGGSYYHLFLRDRPETRASISQTLVLAPERDEAKRVARALAWRLRRLPWQTRRVRTIRVQVKTKDGLSATIVQELAAILSERNVGLSVDTDEEITLKERVIPSRITAAPAAEASAALSPESPADTLPFDPNGGASSKARRPSSSSSRPPSPGGRTPRLTVVHNGKVLECTSCLVARNHSRIPAKLAYSIPKVLRRCGKVPVACTVTIEF